MFILFPYHRSKFELNIFLCFKWAYSKVDGVSVRKLRIKYRESMVGIVPLDRVNLAILLWLSGLPVHRLDRWKFDRGDIPYFCIYPSFPWFNVCHAFTTWGMIIWLELWCLTALSTIVQLYRDSQFHWWSTRRKLPTCCKSPTKIMLYWVRIAWAVFELTTFVMIDTDCGTWYYYSSTHC